MDAFSGSLFARLVLALNPFRAPSLFRFKVALAQLFQLFFSAHAVCPVAGSPACSGKLEAAEILAVYQLILFFPVSQKLLQPNVGERMLEELFQYF